MGRPSEISTKTLSVRIPMETYIEILKEATSNKMSISDYVLLKLLDDNEKNTVLTEDKQEKKWELIDTFSKKETYNHDKIKNVSSIKIGETKYSKDGKHKIKAVKRGVNKVYELK